jgi:hypothetical protein
VTFENTGKEKKKIRREKETTKKKKKRAIPSPITTQVKSISLAKTGGGLIKRDKEKKIPSRVMLRMWWAWRAQWAVATPLPPVTGRPMQSRSHCQRPAPLYRPEATGQSHSAACEHTEQGKEERKETREKKQNIHIFKKPEQKN